MTREVTTVAPETTASQALALCRERRVRHLPVLESEDLVGVVSDRDLRSATPALGDSNRAAALEEIRVEEVMSREVLTAHPDDPIEQAANAMRERRIGCLPVVEGGRLAGIVTASDVMAALVHLLGAHEPGSRIEVSLPDRPGAMAEATSVFRDAGVDIISVISAPETEDGGHTAVFRASTINPRGVVEALESAGFAVLWPPRK